MTNNQSKHVFISTLEHSAEKHCANLIEAIQNNTSESIQFSGFGGSDLSRVGCEILDDTVSRAAMHYNVLMQLGYYRKLIRQANEFFEQNRVDLLVVCDSPAFNFHIAKAAKKHSIPVLFYVAPQLWAWAPWRIRKLRKCCDKLACILPFEKEWFTCRGIDTEFVSNPLFDEMKINLQGSFKPYSNYDSQAPKIAMLPGSRDAEINSLWPAMLEVAGTLKEMHPGAKFTACAPDKLKRSKLEHIYNELQTGIAIDYSVDGVIETTKQADLTLVASGSATLQVAAAGCPMVIMYQSNKLIWHLLGRWLIRIPHLSLVNILAGKELVPEFMPHFTSTKPIIERAHGLLSTPSRMSQISQSLISLVDPLTQRRASDTVADIVIKLLTTDFTD